MKGTPRVTGDRTLMSNIYKYRSKKFLVFVAPDEARSTEPGVPYLSRYPESYYNVSISLLFFLV